MIQFEWYSFDKLTPKQVYDILALRASVFVEHQGSAYLDPDGKDIAAQHLLGVENGELVAYLRLLPPDEDKPDVTFGRVATAILARGKGYGKQMMQLLLTYAADTFPGITVSCSAQYYLKDFYESFGFVTQGEVYDDVGVDHIKMTRKPA